MNFIIKSDTLFTCDQYGNTLRRIAEKVNIANFSEKENNFLVTFLDGSVFLTDSYGNKVRRICDSAIEARFQDGNILVRTKSENVLRDKYGNIIKRL
jgi:hypothetical protein